MSNELPEGFTPQYYYRGDEKTIDPDYAWAEGELFCIKERLPALPLKLVDKAWHRGWEIPTHYAIDANNVCWEDNAHGHTLHPVEANSLLAEISDETQRNQVRKLLGMKTEMPSWAKTAIAAGFIPPPGWTY